MLATQKVSFKQAATNIGIAFCTAIISIIGTSTFKDSAQNTVIAALNYIQITFKVAGEQKSHNGVLLSPEASNRPTDKNIQKLPADVQDLVKFADDLVKPIEIIPGNNKNITLEITKFVEKAGEDGSHEFIELKALKPIDLSNGRIGDTIRQVGSRESLRLPSNLNLNAGDKLRIYTTENFEPTKIVELHQKKGIWKGDFGEKDRVWISTMDGKVVLDYNYKVKEKRPEK
jgi:hypothetical protein